MGKEIYYSDKYEDETHEYRHVILPKVKFLQHSTSIIPINITCRIWSKWCRNTSWCLKLSGGILEWPKAPVGSITCSMNQNLTSCCSRDLFLANNRKQLELLLSGIFRVKNVVQRNITCCYWHVTWNETPLKAVWKPFIHVNNQVHFSTSTICVIKWNNTSD